MSRASIPCLEWFSVEWLTLSGVRSVNALAEVKSVPGWREVHSKDLSDGSWSVVAEPYTELAVYVEAVRDEKGISLDLDECKTAERFALYEALRAAYRAKGGDA